MAKHTLIRSLPADIRDKLDVLLTQRRPMSECAALIRTSGALSKLNDASLCRALRRYREDAITVNEAARAQAVAQASPKVRARITEAASAIHDIAKMRKIVESREKSFWDLVSKTPPGVAAMSDGLRRAAQQAFEMRERITKLSMDAGLIPRAAQKISITAEMVVIRNQDDANAILQALVDFVGRTQDVHPHLPQATAGIQRILQRPQALPPGAARVWAEMRASLAQTEAEERAALPIPSVRQEPEPEDQDDEEGVALVFDDDQRPDLEVIERQPPKAWGGRTLEGEAVRVNDAPEDDGVPHLSTIW